MKKRHVFAALLGTAVLLFSSLAVGQEQARNALKSGESALSFAAPSGGNPYIASEAPGDTTGIAEFLAQTGNRSVLGYHYMLTDNIRGGLNLGFNVLGSTIQTPGGDDTDVTSIGVTVAPQVNYYFSTRGTVAPYFFGLFDFSTFSDGNDDTTGDFEEAQDDDTLAFNAAEQTTLDLQLGIGAEWFPVPRFSVSGQVGLNASLLPTDRPLGDDPADPDAYQDNSFGINLFTSRIAANIYF